MKQGQILALIQAHYSGDSDRFKRTILQIAADIKNPSARNLWTRLADNVAPTAMLMLPPETKNVVEIVPAIDSGALVLSAELRAALAEFVLERSSSERLIARGMFPRSRLLFTGPPGCGKTSCASAIAGELGRTAYRVHFPGLIGEFLGSTAKRLRDAIQPLMRAGAVVILDEIDAIGTPRTNGSSGADREYNVVVSSLLTELDAADVRGIFIATTNRPELLDPALRRRFEDEFHFAAPTEECKTELARSLWERFGLEPIMCPRPNGEVSFDAVVKMVTKAARRVVLAEARGAA